MGTAAEPVPTGTPRPMRADARRNYDRLVTAARDAFIEQGVEAPLDDIARRACVGPGTLYRHFPNRDALIEAVYRGEIARLADRAEELLAELPPAEAVFEWMREQVGFVVNNRGLSVTLKSVIDHSSETFTWCHTALRAAAATILRPAQEAGGIRADTQPADLLRIGHGIGVAAQRASAEDTERLITMMLDGLRPQPG